MKKINQTALVMVIGTLLTGCFEENNVKEIKGLVYKEIDATQTLGNFLDTRKMCEETNWYESVDERKRNVVTYTCTLTGYEYYFNQWNNEAIEKIITENQPKLKQLRYDYSTVNANKKQDINYFAFVEKMAKQNVIPALALVKRKTPSIIEISKIAGNQTEDSAKGIGVPDETIAAFMAASKLYTSALNSNEFGKDFFLIFVNRYMHSFEEIIDGVNNGKSVDEIVMTQKKEEYNSDKNIADIKERLVAVEKQLNVEELEKVRHQWERKQPTNIVQHIVFTPTEQSFKILNCGFDFYTPDSKSIVAYSQDIDNDTTCLQISYQSDYSHYYINMLKINFINSLNNIDQEDVI